MTLQPIYGRQLIRFAETFQVAPAVQVNAHRVVVLDSPAGSSMPLYVKEGTSTSLGISQYLVSQNVPPTGFATDGLRVLTVATSGLLLVEADETLDGDSIGTALHANLQGVATEAVEIDEEEEEEEEPEVLPVTINGGTPTIREVIDIGETHYVLVSI